MLIVLLLMATLAAVAEFNIALNTAVVAVVYVQFVIRLLLIDIKFETAVLPLAFRIPVNTPVVPAHQTVTVLLLIDAPALVAAPILMPFKAIP